MDKLTLFFDEDEIPSILTDRINDEYFHIGFDRALMPVEVPEVRSAAQLIIKKLKRDRHQYFALLRSIGVTEESLEQNASRIDNDGR